MSAIDLSLFKEHLNDAAQVNATDAELQRTLNAAEALVAKKCGPLAKLGETLAAHASGGNLVLPRTRLKSVVEVRDPDGNVVQLGRGAVNLLSGIVALPYRRAGAWEVDIEGDADAEIPADLQLAVLIIAAHLWETQRVPGRAGVMGQQTAAAAATVPMGFAIPNRAATLMAPYQIPALA